MSDLLIQAVAWSVVLVVVAVAARRTRRAEGAGAADAPACCADRDAPSGSGLMPVELQQIAAIQEIVDQDDPDGSDPTHQTARLLADHLRTQLPDVGDTTIGRVLLSGATLLAVDVPAETVWMVNTLALAGVELTELEWGQPR